MRSDVLIAVLDTTGGEDDDCLFYSYPRQPPATSSKRPPPLSVLKGVLTAAVGIADSLTAQTPRCLVTGPMGLPGLGSEGLDTADRTRGSGGEECNTAQLRAAYATSGGYVLALVAPSHLAHEVAQIGAIDRFLRRVRFNHGCLDAVFPGKLRDPVRGSPSPAEQRANVEALLDPIAHECLQRLTGSRDIPGSARARMGLAAAVGGTPCFLSASSPSLSGPLSVLTALVSAPIGGAERDPMLLEPELVPLGAALFQDSMCVSATLAGRQTEEIAEFLAANGLTGRSASRSPTETWRAVHVSRGDRSVGWMWVILCWGQKKKKKK
jgi:hypothetical protein